MKKQGNRKKDIVYYSSMAILAAVFLVSGGMLVNRYRSERRQDAAWESITSMFSDTGMSTPDGDAVWPDGGDVRLDGDAARRDGTGQDDERDAGQMQMQGGSGNPAKGEGNEERIHISPGEWKLRWEQEAERRFATYRELQSRNPDMAGWIRIEGTRIDYPVMQTPDEPDYYLHRDFNKKKSSYGIPYMAEFCRYEEPGTNLLIYGHHMRNGAMFAALDGYTEEAYYREHPFIQFDTVDRAGSYEIAAAVRIDASGEAAIWQDLLFPSEEAVWKRAWEAFRQQSFYQTGVDLEYGDRLLALVTCEYTLKDGRLMVVAREIR